MKAGDFGRLLRAGAAITGRRSLDRIATPFDTSPSATVAATLARIRREPESPFWAEGTIATADLTLLRPLLMLVAKAGVLKDVDAAITALKLGPSSHVPAAPSTRKRGATRDDLIAEHVSSLEDALGSESRFPVVYDRLASDSRLGAADHLAIARQFAKAATKTKADALKKVWARHQSILMFDAKGRATEGRSAA